MQAEQAQHREQAAVPVQAPPAPVAHEVREEKPPVREERPAPRGEAPRAEAPRVDPKEILESAGLVMIETDRSKVPVQAPQAEEPQPLGRPRRERPKPPSQDAELVQIETRK